jgi:hypothetical protein
LITPTSIDFIADEHIPADVILFLRQRGHTVYESRQQVGMGAADPEIAAWASANRCVVLTADKWFREALSRRPSHTRVRYPGAGRLLFGRGVREPEMLNRLRVHIDRIEREYIDHQAEHDPRLLIEITEIRIAFEC